MDQELDDVKVIHDEQMANIAATGHASIHKNMPKVSGGLKWAAELRDRLQAPIGNFNHIEHP